MKLPLSLAICVTIFAAPAQAANYYLFSYKSDTAAFLDFDTLKDNQNGTRRIWITQVEKDTSVYAYLRTVGHYNCADELIQTVLTVAYDVNDKVLTVVDTPDKFTPAVPGSAGAVALKMVCSDEGPPESRHVGDHTPMELRVIFNDIQGKAGAPKE